MFWFPSVPRPTVLVFCALGKGAGAYLVFLSGDRFRQTKLFTKVMRLLRLEALWLALSDWMERVMQRFGFFGFIALMSIPAMPMRSAIYSVSLLKINGAKFAIGVMAGTIVRNSLVYMGYISLKTILS